MTVSRSDALKAAALLLLLLAPTLILPWTDHGLSGGEFLGTLGFALWILLAPLVLIGRLRWYLLLGLPLVPLALVWLYVCHLFRSVPGDVLVSAALDSGWAQWMEMLGAAGWPLLAVPVAMGIYLALALSIRNSARVGWPARKALLAALLLYALAGTAGRQWLGLYLPLPPLFDSTAAGLSFPAGLALSVDRTLEHRHALNAKVSVHGHPAADAPPQLLVVLVIGESVRVDHLGLNGYARNTTPKLTELGPALLSFSHVASTAQWTAVAMPNIVSQEREGGREGGREHGRANLMQTFAEAGFRTAWLSNQERTTLAAAADVSEFADGARDFHLRSDRVLLPLFESFVAQAGARQFVVLHMIGSHYPYEERYAADSRRFTPTLPALAEGLRPGVALKQEAINSYDNTIVETDKFLRRVIDRLNREQRPAVMLYISDHGENLFDDERQMFMHALPTLTRHDLDVPLLVWANPAYREADPARLQALREHQRARIGQVDVFPTLLDLGHVAWGGAAPQDSFASASYTEKPRRLANLSGWTGSSDEVR
ncbi:MAG TPA: phosphoethanolamine transferase [Burkholderiaceae bacterium]|jgi:glucan phosphoethanolaminetransferase (alkaline phosphatase superfamily)